MKKYKPGPGWKKISNAVYEKKDKRIHLLGLCRIEDTYIKTDAYPESLRLNKFIRINGGNRKRGMMAWANTL